MLQSDMHTSLYLMHVCLTFCLTFRIQKYTKVTPLDDEYLGEKAKLVCMQKNKVLNFYAVRKNWWYFISKNVLEFACPSASRFGSR